MPTRRKVIQSLGAGAFALSAGGILAPKARGLIMLGGSAAPSGSWQLPAGHYVNSPLALTIIGPYAGLSTANRYYMQYPGILYRVPVLAYGGAWPYQYEVTGPSGMTVGQHYGDTDYGIINWSNPTTGTHSCTVTVTDQLGVTASVTWTLTVQTANFIFIDSVNGHPSSANGGTGTGTLSNPFKTLDDWYSGAAGSSGSTSARKNDTTYSGYFVYYRAGSYACVPIETADTGMRMPCVSGNKPKVHLGYPEETAIFDTTNAAFIVYSDTSQGPWFGGLTATGMGSGGDYKWVEWDSGVTDTVFFGNTFDTPVTAGVIGTNPAFLMSRDNPPNVTSRIGIVHNTFGKTLSHDYFLAYETQYGLFEWNTFADVNDSNGLYLKLDLNDTWTARANTGLAANTGRGLVCLDNYNGVTNVDVCWNNYKSTGAGIYYGPDGGGTGIAHIASYRNTWQISEHTIDGVPVSNLTVTDDVVQFTDSSANAHGYQIINSGSLSSATYAGEECVGLNGSFVNSSGDLVSPYTSYVGIRGYKVA